MKPRCHTCGPEKKKIKFLLNQYVKAVQKVNLIAYWKGNYFPFMFYMFFFPHDHVIRLKS